MTVSLKALKGYKGPNSDCDFNVFICHVQIYGELLQAPHEWDGPIFPSELFTLFKVSTAFFRVDLQT